MLGSTGRVSFMFLVNTPAYSPHVHTPVSQCNALVCPRRNGRVHRGSSSDKDRVRSEKTIDL